MRQVKQIRRALISVYHKEPSRKIIEVLSKLGVSMVSTGGTLDFIRSLGIAAVDVAQVTGFPEVLDGRVKTLHPAIFGGILARQNRAEDLLQLGSHGIEPFDLIVVDLYPFAETVSQGSCHADVLEKIDIGGISLIRAAAKNYTDVLVVPAQTFFEEACTLLSEQNGSTSLEQRKKFASAAFQVSARYDAAIGAYFAGSDTSPWLENDIPENTPLRYGENPHQEGLFIGNLNKYFHQLHGKELSYNNLLDIEAAVGLIAEFSDPAFAVIKHTNVCGFGVGTAAEEAMDKALRGDPLSLFGGILVSNRPISNSMAQKLHDLFFEVLIAPEFLQSSLTVLQQRKNRILLIQNQPFKPKKVFRSVLGGVLQQTADIIEDSPGNWRFATKIVAEGNLIDDLFIANRIVKHLKSNAIALVRDGMLIGVGSGQTSRIDAVQISLRKASHFGHSTTDAVLASDAFFPFADWVEAVQDAGICAVVQPGGSVRDSESIEKCNHAGIAMAFTGLRHFRH